MATNTTMNVAQQASLLRPRALNHHSIHHLSKSNSFFSLKFPFNPRTLQSKFNHPKPSTLLNPLTTLPTLEIHSQRQNTILCACTVWGHSFFGPGRADFRVGSRRRPGSRKKKGRLIVTLECSECRKNRHTTEKRAKGVNPAEKGKVNKQNTTPDRLQLSKYCPKCRKHKLHMEVKK